MQTDYQKQATDFLDKMGATIKITYLKTGLHFDGDKDQRDIYEVELSRKGRSYKFNFGNSINASGEFLLHDYRLIDKFNRRFISKNEAKRLGQWDIKQSMKPNKNYSQPSAYDVLAALTKYDPGTFDNFCNDFDYSNDSKKAERIYNAVREEYLNVSRLFNEDELNEMREIQ